LVVVGRARFLRRGARIRGHLSFALLVSVLGCENESVDRAARSARAQTETTSQKVVVLDLVRDLPSAWVDREIDRIELLPRTQRRFTHGWWQINAPSDDEPSIWSTGRASVIELPVVELADRTLSLDVEPLMAPDQLPHQTVRISWNDHDLGRHVLDWKRQTITLDIPAAIQTLGLNRLRLEPLWWISAMAARISFNDRDVGLKLYGLSLSGAPEARAAGLPGVRIQRDDVIQHPGSLVAWHYRLPDAPRLRTSLGWQGGRPPAHPMRWTLSVLEESGKQTVLASHEMEALAAGEEIALDIDLSAWAGQRIGLQATLAGRRSRDVLVWRAPRIDGVEQRSAFDPSNVRDQYDLLFVLFDTLRADHLAPYGNEVIDTPALQALSDSGFTFDRAYANASWTRPSVASLWTGLRPTAHQVITASSTVPEAAPYLPAILSKAGYLTVAVSNNAHFSSDFGFGRGFEQMYDYFDERPAVLDEHPSPAAQAEQLWSRFLAPAFEQQTERPVFAVVHEIDPHSPYEAPPPFADRYEFGYEGNIDGWNIRNVKEGMRMLRAVNDYGEWLGEADKLQMRAQYMAEVSFVDAYFGEIMKHLERSGRRDRTLVVFLSDHGEQFFEHGLWGHGRSLHEEELHVPLIFSLPGVVPAASRTALPVQLLDIVPTVLDLVGVEGPQPQHGRSLLREILSDSGSKERGDPIFARSNTVFHHRNTVFQSSEWWHSVQLPDWKLIRQTRSSSGTRVDTYALYDLARDPDELLDRWPHERVIGFALKQLLESKLQQDERVSFEAGTSREMDPDVLENLRGLGYLE
jgi:arylsulfatase A-like enzyme